MVPICVNSFYSPASMSGYLTPLQRKKLREMRNASLSCSLPLEKTVPTKKKGKFRTSVKLKLKSKPTKKVSLSRLSSASAPVFYKCAVSKIVARATKETFKEKRFFKTRRPDHLTETVFSLPLQRKRIRLNFGAERNDKMNHHKQGAKSSLCPAAIETQEQILDSLQIKKHMKSAMFVVSSPDNASDEYVEKSLFNSSFEISDKQKQEDENPFNIDFQFPSDEELLKLQTKAREEQRKLLALKSHKKSVSVTETSPKLYPIFTTPFKPSKELIDQSTPKSSKKSFLDTSKGNEQLIIDAGQKEIGAKVCAKCNMSYFIGQKEDEHLHSCYHNSYLGDLIFRGWKNEHVLATFEDGRIIQVKKTDERYKLKRVKNVISIANRDLGFPDMEIKLKDEMVFFLFVSYKKKIGGCLVAEPIKTASPVVSDENSTPNVTSWNQGIWYASSKTVPAVCGINRIWVSEECRRQKVASRLVDCLRQNFIYAHVLDSRELAFSDPSLIGREFASAYTGTDNFLVYK